MSSDKDNPAGQTVPRPEVLLPPPTPKVPAVVPAAATRRRDRSWLRPVLLLLVLLAAGAGGYAWFHAKPALPPGIVAANGRLEADQIDIATKFAGRVDQLFVDEGDMVKASQAVATMDTRDLAASLKKAQSLANQAQQVLWEAQAIKIQMAAYGFFNIYTAQVLNGGLSEYIQLTDFGKRALLQLESEPFCSYEPGEQRQHRVVDAAGWVSDLLTRAGGGGGSRPNRQERCRAKRARLVREPLRQSGTQWLGCFDWHPYLCRRPGNCPSR
jgi:Biotin-lipoyl like